MDTKEEIKVEPDEEFFILASRQNLNGLTYQKRADNLTMNAIQTSAYSPNTVDSVHAHVTNRSIHGTYQQEEQTQQQHFDDRVDHQTDKNINNVK